MAIATREAGGLGKIGGSHLDGVIGSGPMLMGVKVAGMAGRALSIGGRGSGGAAFQ